MLGTPTGEEERIGNTRKGNETLYSLGKLHTLTSEIEGGCWIEFLYIEGNKKQKRKKPRKLSVSLGFSLTREGGGKRRSCITHPEKNNKAESHNRAWKL